MESNALGFVFSSDFIVCHIAKQSLDNIDFAADISVSVWDPPRRSQTIITGDIHCPLRGCRPGRSVYDSMQYRPLIIVPLDDIGAAHSFDQQIRNLERSTVDRFVQ